MIGGPWRFPSRRTLSWSSFGTGANFGQHSLLNLYLAAGTDGGLVVGCFLPTRERRPKLQIRLDKKYILINHFESNSVPLNV